MKDKTTYNRRIRWSTFGLTLLFSLGLTLTQAQWIEEQKILAQLPEADFYINDDDQLGYAIDIDGNQMVVSARNSDQLGNNSGLAAIYTWDGTEWDEGQNLISPATNGGDQFGTAVAISTSWAIIGTNTVDEVYLFEKQVDETWTYHSSITPIGVHSSDLFGLSLDISGELAIVGDTEDDDAGGAAGAAFIYAYDSGSDSWSEIKKLTASDASVSDKFGYDVGISGITAVVSALEEDDGGSNAGAAYVFSKNLGGTGNWGEVKKLVASNAGATDRFGLSVAIDTDRIVIGADQEDTGGSNSGAAYLFERNEGGSNNWGEKIIFKAASSSSNDRFGNDVDLFSDRVIVGAKDDTYLGSSQMGTAYVYEMDEGGVENWGLSSILYPSDLQNQDDFGFAVGISGDHALAGMPLGDLQGANSGAWYHYLRDISGGWSENVVILGTDGQVNDQAGNAIAIDGSRAIVGSKFSDSTGDGSGKAYIFEKDSAGDWIQVAELPSPDGAVNDQFGSAVAISGDRAVVGAPNYASFGAVFMYVRTIDGWELDTSKVETSGSFGEYFGTSLSFHDDVILVGDAPWNISTFNTGSVSVLMRDPGTGVWNRYGRILKDPSISHGPYGFSCSVDFEENSSGTHLRAAIGHVRGTIEHAYVYEMSWVDSTWSFVQELIPTASGSFGQTLAIHNERILVGSPTGAGFNRGQASLFEQDSGTGSWIETEHYTPNLIGSNHSIASSLDMKDDLIVLGGPNADPGISNAGITYVYRYNSSTEVWSLEQELTHSVQNSSDAFGAAVAIGDNELLISSTGDDDNGSNAGAFYSFQPGAIALNESCAEASPISPSVFGIPSWENYPLGTSQSLTGCSGDADDDIWFSFIAQSANDVIMAQDPAEGYNAVIELYDACGETALACFSTYESGAIERARYGNLTVGQEYFFRVYDAATGPSPSTDVRVMVKTFEDGGLRSSNCGQTYELSQLVYAERDDYGELYSNPNVPVKGYRFKFKEQGGGLEVVAARPDLYPYIPLANVNGLEYGKTYDVSVSHLVRFSSNEVIANHWSSFGTPCPITIQANVPTTQLKPNVCNNGNYFLSQAVQAIPVAGASQYLFKFEGSGDVIVESSDNYTVFLYNVGNSSLGLKYGPTYNVQVNVLSNGSWSGYGPTCTIGMEGQPEMIKLRPNSCNGTFDYPAPNALLAETVLGASYYQWRATPVGGGSSQTDISSGIALPLHLTSIDFSDGGDWDIEVRAFAGGVLGEYGASCPVTINSSAMAPPNQEFDAQVKSLHELNLTVLIYPNPNDGDEFRFRIEGLSENGSAEIFLRDIQGRLIESRSYVYNEKSDFIWKNTSSLEPGVYMLETRVGQQRITSLFTVR